MISENPLYYFRVEYTACSGQSATQGCVEYVWARDSGHAAAIVHLGAPPPIQRFVYEARRVA